MGEAPFLVGRFVLLSKPNVHSQTKSGSVAAVYRRGEQTRRELYIPAATHTNPVKVPTYARTLLDIVNLKCVSTNNRALSCTSCLIILLTHSAFTISEEYWRRYLTSIYS